MANARDEETKQSEPLSVHEQASPPPSPAPAPVAPGTPAVEAAPVAEAAPASIDVEITGQQTNDAAAAALEEAAPPVVEILSDDDGDDGVDVTEQQIASCRSALRHRLKSEQSGGGDMCRVMGVESCVAQIELLFERTVQFGENQSGLLLGSVGSATRAIVLQAMRNLRRKHGAFTHVYLNGTILQNEIEAFKEITSQLTRNQAVKHQSLSYWNMYEYLKGLLAERAAADEPVMVILDSFEKFALETGSSKQLLLYNLLDWLQSKDIKMGVLGISDNFNVIDNLEKRVRSRFSSLQIVIDRPTFPQVKELMAAALSLRTIDWDTLPNARILRRPSDKFMEQFDTKVAALFKDETAVALPTNSSKSNSSALLLASLQFDYDIGKPLEFFLRIAAAAVFYLSVKEPFVSVRHFQDAKHLLEQDHQLATLKTINDHGIALMIGMSQLEKDGQRFFTLEMVYARWQAFYRKHDLLHQLPTRSEAQKALENLLRLQLVKDAGDAFRIGRSTKHAAPESLQPEYRVVYLNFAPRTLEGMIRNRSIKCSTAMVEWAVNGA